MYQITDRGKTNPQSGSASSSSGGNAIGGNASFRSLPPLFLYMETGDWARATERAKRHPREVKTWASIRSKSTGGGENKISSAKRLALHQACLKLRNSISSTGATYNPTDDPFVEVCRFIIMLLEIYPDAAGMRESRHGCLPLHLAAFASCLLPTKPEDKAFPGSPNSTSSPGGIPPLGKKSPGAVPRPSVITNQLRAVSENTEATIHTSLSAGMAEECFAGAQTEYLNAKEYERTQSNFSEGSGGQSTESVQPTLSVSMGHNILISQTREEWAVRVLDALLDAFPKAIRMDSEGGRLPLHTACAGRATPRVVSTLIRAYPAAARHRNKDGFLPLHLCAHWGISHPNVVVALLKTYPDATFGRNRWERTPLEEALCMAGENGRPHQSTLVRALRKHPSYWTRPTDLFETAPSPRESNTSRLVDVDVSLPSNDDDESSESDHIVGGGVEKGNQKGRYSGMFRKSRNGEGIEAVTTMVADLPTLIKNQNWTAVLAKLKATPYDAMDELQVTTRGGFTSISGFFSLHYACERRPPLEVVKALIAAYPEAVASRAMPGGVLPLHIACTWYAPVPVVNALLSADRAACKTADELGNLPLHAACFSGTETSAVESLIRTYPKATLARNNQGSLPEEITKRLKHANRQAIIALLNLCKEEVLSKRDAKHRRNRSEGCIGSVHAANTVGGRDGPPVAAAMDNQELVWI